MSWIIKLLLQFATSKAAEELVGYGVNKLLDSKDSGIGKDLAGTMINGIVASKSNPATAKVFEAVLEELK